MGIVFGLVTTRTFNLHKNSKNIVFSHYLYVQYSNLDGSRLRTAVVVVSDVHMRIVDTIVNQKLLGFSEF